MLTNFRIIEQNKKLLSANFYSSFNSDLQIMKLLESEHILCCFHNAHCLKIALVYPETVKLHEFNFPEVKFSLTGKIFDIKLKDSLNKSIKSYTCKVVLLKDSHLQIFHMGFDVDEGMNQFVLLSETRFETYFFSKIAILSPRVLCLVDDQYSKFIQLFDWKNKTVMLKKNFNSNFFKLISRTWNHTSRNKLFRSFKNCGEIYNESDN